ncbi:hypothetical protein BELL_0260g00080 [Botrytis elliptica]|uniref:Uncharacterized protein n=1 Tax=Botrytis elliptica TaxID=278938 RepID=A0A4Z1JLT6_9HELO|nr:hypothetical protein EAE99_003895 [Botrytis elliptica]TGO74729.1 hypothetical protein BELL_0260g00080 [Botrytis elliptica]
MPASSQSGTSRRVQFDTSIAKSPCIGPSVTRNPINDEYYLRMVFSEKKMLIKSSMVPQDELEISDQERCEAKRQIQFEPEKKGIRQHHHMNEEYYHRMVAIESKMWQEANSGKQAEAEMLDKAPHGALRRVKFQDSVLKSPDSINTYKNNAKNQLYDRMVELETKIWIEGGVNTQSGADDRSKGEMSST